MIRRYVAVDLETTGLNPARDKILEIGAVKIKNGEITDTYETFVNPGIRIPEAIHRLTGIDDEMAAEGLLPNQAIREFIAFCGDDVLLGHNIYFDFSFLKSSAVNAGEEFEKDGIDTLKIARTLLPDLEKRSLGFLCEHYQISHVQKHRALGDAMAAKELYDKLVQQFPDVDESVFKPRKMTYQAKKQGPITIPQKAYLQDLLKYHRIDVSEEIDRLTKNEASRLIDKILLEHGKIPYRRR